MADLTEATNGFLTRPGLFALGFFYGRHATESDAQYPHQRHYTIAVFTGRTRPAEDGRTSRGKTTWI